MPIPSFRRALTLRPCVRLPSTRSHPYLTSPRRPCQWRRRGDDVTRDRDDGSGCVALPGTMRAMVLEAPGRALRLVERPVPTPAPGQVLVRVAACGVCRTDLHVVDGELPDPALPIVPGHEVVGTVVALGAGVERLRQGERVGVPWLGYSCGTCGFCHAGRENLCERARFTGYQIDGGYGEFMLPDQRYCFPLPAAYGHARAAPPSL